MGLKKWIGRQTLNAAADELEKGVSMNPKIKAMLEAAAWLLIATILGSIAAAIQDGSLTKEEFFAAVSAGLAAVAALFRQKPQM